MLLSLIAVWIVIFTWWIILTRRKYVEPPVCAGGLPIIGHILTLLGTGVDYWELMKKCSKHAAQSKGVSRLILGPRTFYFISDPDDCTTVLQKCLDKGDVYDLVKEWFGDGLVTSVLPLWKKNRKLFNPAFATRVLDSYMEVFNCKSRELVRKLATEVGKGTFNPYWYMSNHILETVSKTTLGHRPDDMINTNYAYETDNLFVLFIERVKKTWLLIPFFYNRSNLKKQQDIIMNKAKDLRYEVIRKRKLDLEGDHGMEESTKSTLDFILGTPIKNEISSDEDIRQHLETFIIAGYDTTSTTLVYALKSIGTRPDVQKQIYEEIQQVFGESDRDVEKEDLPKLLYLEAVIKETIRLYPPVPVVGRTVHDDIKLKNYTLRKGSSIVGSIYGVNRHPLWGEDADEFNPDRWLNCKRPPAGLFAGFSLGRRNCVDSSVAPLSRKIKTKILIGPPPGKPKENE
ncbi:cytochrome P450 4V2-like [Anticarsia gemmatalis]|uniref:cytochrome P450 4V2-like n=1 Tax=Anticarsia gemmatalis TaxID=129554 RepID=UPI003F7718E8